MPPGMSFVLALLLITEVGVTEFGFSKHQCNFDCNVAHIGTDWLQKEEQKLRKKKRKLLAEKAKIENDLENIEKPMAIGMISNELWRNKFKLVSNNRLNEIKEEIDSADQDIKRIEKAQKILG